MIKKSEKEKKEAQAYKFYDPTLVTSVPQEFFRIFLLRLLFLRCFVLSSAPVKCLGTTPIDAEITSCRVFVEKFDYYSCEVYRYKKENPRAVRGFFFNESFARLRRRAGFMQLDLISQFAQRQPPAPKTNRCAGFIIRLRTCFKVFSFR